MICRFQPGTEDELWEIPKKSDSRPCDQGESSLSYARQNSNLWDQTKNKQTNI